MTRLIRAGDTGLAVSDVQQRLARVLGEDLSRDGVFGPGTLEQVRRFQRARGLPADGIVGPETWRSLVEAGWRLGDRLLWHSRRMMRGDDVRELQHRLNRLGFDAGGEDGILGPDGRAAVEEFQRNIGLDVDGVAGPQTVAALRRLHRDHQSGGVAARVREREWLRGLSRRGLAGARVLVDPSHGDGDVGHVGASGTTEAVVAWQIAVRVAARLDARGADAILSRGPGTNPTARERARLANELGCELVLSIGLNGLGVPEASGASTYYFGGPHFASESGLQLAELLHAAIVGAGWTPDCRVHPMTWSILRETRMPAVVTEPGFITSPHDEAQLVCGARQDNLADVLVDGIERFLARTTVVPA